MVKKRFLFEKIWESNLFNCISPGKVELLKKLQCYIRMRNKPKILLITNLYPESSTSSEIDATRALHNFARCWSSDAIVMVIRPIRRVNIRNFSTANLFSRSVRNVIDGIKIHTLIYIDAPRLGIFMYKYFLKLLSKEHFTPDIIITHRANNFSIGDQLATLLSVPHIVGVHASCLLKISLYRNIFSRADRIACRSSSIKRRFIKELPEFSNKIFVANSGIDKERILDKNYFMKKNFLLKSKTLKLISVCNLIPLKNIDIVLKALSCFSNDINWHYTIIGDGQQRVKLQELAKTLSIDDKVTFMGYIENSQIYKYLDESSVFLMISSPETFGIAYLEAMARGNIVIGTKNWGIDGIVIDGENGYLCEEISADILMKKLSGLIRKTPAELYMMLNKIYFTINNITVEEMSKIYLVEIERCMQKNQNFIE